DAVGLGGFGAFAVAEDVDGLGAVRAGKARHVFDHAEDFHVDLAEHFDGFANVGEGNDRRRGNHYCAGNRDGLNECELYVAGAGRKVDDEVIEFAPLDAAQKLRDDGVQHRPAPDHGLVAGIEQAHRDHLHALGVDRNDLLAHGGERFLSGAEHDRHVGAVDIGVEQADFVAELGESEGKVDGYGGFANAAFAAG